MAWFVKWYAPYVSPAIERIAEEQARHKAMLDAMIEGLAVEHGQADDEGRLKVLGNRSVFSWMRPPSSMSQGFRWPSYDEPLRDRITSRPKVMKDIVCSSFGYAVSDKARQVIEAVEPGVHQFLPFAFVNKRGVIDPERRWLLNVCNRIDAIDVEKSGPNIVEAPEGTIWRNAGPMDLVMSRDRMADRHLWYEWRYVHPGVVVSDVLWAALKKAKCSGWSTRDNHMPEV